MGNNKDSNKLCRNRERKEYYKKNREKIREQQSRYYQKNRERLKKKSSDNYYSNLEKARLRHKKYYETYKDVINAKRLSRKRSDPKLRIICNLRSRLSSIIRGKSRKTMDLMGCDRNHLLKHLEVQFKKGMTWANYAKRWTIDHHIPISAFDHENKKEMDACWHFSNLKPMWKRDNIRKGKKICLER